MTSPSKTVPDEAPGHYGAGYGEKQPGDAAPEPTSDDGVAAPAGLEPLDPRLDPAVPPGRRPA